MTLKLNKIKIRSFYAYIKISSILFTMFELFVSLGLSSELCADDKFNVDAVDMASLEASAGCANFLGRKNSGI
jgi:hypothetical protein